MVSPTHASLLLQINVISPFPLLTVHPILL
jgi:hypothetical protein